MRVKSRRAAREAALRALYEVEVGKTSPETSIQNIEAFGELSEDLREFACQVVKGVLSNLGQLDSVIGEKLRDYGLDRVATVDRNLLRIACFELLHCPEIPPKVTLNEAIDLAKKYSTAESGKFVNGVLAAILSESPKAVWSARADEEILEESPSEPEPVVEQLELDSPEAQELAKVGKWTLRSEEKDA